LGLADSDQPESGAFYEECGLFQSGLPVEAGGAFGAVFVALFGARDDFFNCVD
jgi:hypothetical protein